MLIMALPLIMVSLSENIMVFFDRVILAHYSLPALNAVSLASQSIEVCQYALWSMSSMAEIVIARLYAKGQLTEMAKPTWQMIYLSLATLPLIIILSKSLGNHILPKAYHSVGSGYFHVAIYTIPLIGIITALSAYFVGQGKLKLILFSTIFINIINVSLDILLVFGYKHWIPSLGATGPAISAVLSLSLQTCWLLAAFLSKNQRKLYQTFKLHFHYQYFAKIIKIGTPISLCHIFELLGWIVIFKAVALTTVKNFTILSMGSTLFLIYSFVNDGLYRSLTTVISNHLAAKHVQSIQKSLFAALLLLMLFLLVSLIPLFFMPSMIIELFHLKKYFLAWQVDIRMSLRFMWVYFSFIGLYWIFAAVLTAFHHTRFILIGNTLSFWVLTALPIYLLVHSGYLHTLAIWPIICVSAITSCTAISIYYFKVLKKAQFNDYANET